MLFNSYQFIFIFLPLTVILYYLFAKLNKKYSQYALLIASLIFYGYWNYRYIPLIIGSVFINYYLGMLLSKKKINALLIIGIITNLSILGYYKYSNFFLNNINGILGTSYNFIHIILPLGISFYTFQNIAYIVDCYKNSDYEKDFVSYSLCIIFFAKVSQGPIVHYKDIIPQIKNPQNNEINFENLNKGLFYFSFGLFKKVIIADALATYITPGFDYSTSLTFVEAWGIALSYTLQLYFDFSGYTDMAIGIGYFFNYKLPQNFESPYQSNNIIDFWRRWHITLGDFLKNYLYIPLGGNRRGLRRKYLNLFILMTICGLWHGASWTYILWGSVHGIFLIINNIVKKIKIRIYPLVSRLITFISVLLAWVLFRANDISTAIKVYKGMMGLNGIEFSNLIYFDKRVLLYNIIGFIIVMLIPSPNKIYKTKRKPNIVWTAALIIILLISIINLNKPTEFLYFQF